MHIQCNSIISNRQGFRKGCGWIIYYSGEHLYDKISNKSSLSKVATLYSLRSYTYSVYWWFSVFVDFYYFLERVWIYFLKHKNKVFPTFKKEKVLVEKQSSKNVKRLRIDNSMEFCRRQFNKFYEMEGIVTHCITRKTL